MENRLVGLKLILDEAGVGSSIQTMRQRKQIQKLVYLLQAKGVPTNYSFGWYIMGTYSTGLTRDYYALNDLITVDGDTVSGTLKSSVRADISDLRPVLRSPISGIPNEDWLELLAAVHYLRTKLRYDDAQVDRLLSEQKPHVAKYRSEADTALATVGLG